MSDSLIPIEVYNAADVESDKPLFVAHLPAVPRVGERLAKAIDGYFQFYDVREVWYRQNWDLPPDGPWWVCLSVQLDD